ncbi:YtxH domain-containing protein [Virgibacillus sp. L01]|uniref:YtxH domain-containing protein n=1 Tax=Virgibacillus sp. L01 TaxID=3457429 RepID=UPI003FD5020E
MGKRNVLFGVLMGAIVGGLVSLFNNDARNYTKLKMNYAKNRSGYYMKHPSEAVRSARDSFDKFNKEFSSGAENAINALEQVENTLDKFANKDQKDLESNL